MMNDQIEEVELQGDSVDFRSALADLLNSFSKENGSNTPDWVLRDYLCDCLKAFDRATKTRDKWYNVSHEEHTTIQEG